MLSGSVVANNYKVDIVAPLPGTSFYLSVTESGSYIISGSISTGSAQTVFFDVFNLVKNPTTIKKITVSPTWNYPTYFSGSIVILAATSSIPVSGYAEYLTLVPGSYQVDLFGKIDTSFFISVPATYPSTWNAKDLIIIKPSKGIPVNLTNLDNSYILTVSSSDARYMLAGSGTQNITASHALTSNTASYITSSNIRGNVTAFSASWASSSISSSYADSINREIAGNVSINNISGNTSTLKIAGLIMGGKTLELTSTPAGATIGVTGGELELISPINIFSNNIITTTGKFLGTASFSDTSSYFLGGSTGNSISSSWASASISSSFSNTSNYSEFADSSSYASTSSYLMGYTQSNVVYITSQSYSQISPAVDVLYFVLSDTNYRLTEAGFTRVTEAGFSRIT